MSLVQRWSFLREYLQSPDIVGAVAPSSPALALALCEPFRRSPRPVKVLEVGAGTGAITRCLGRFLSSEDELDICEVQPHFARILEREVLTRADFAAGMAEGRVRLLCSAVQDLSYERRYDFVISGLPLTAFILRDVRDVFRTLRGVLKPGGVLSYFEYVGFRRASRLLAVGKHRRRFRLVSAYLSRSIRNHQFDRRIVMGNLPPAHARHLRFDA